LARRAGPVAAAKAVPSATIAATWILSLGAGAHAVNPRRPVSPVRRRRLRSSWISSPDRDLGVPDPLSARAIHHAGLGVRLHHLLHA
jgi:hypothetical protein